MSSQNRVAEFLQVRNQLESNYKDSRGRLKGLVDELSNLKQRAKDCLKKHDREGAKRYLYRMHDIRRQTDLLVMVIKKQQTLISEMDAKLSHVQS
ncbi:ATP-dependent Clp protease ATP-binding subunit ClpB [Giardia lamblia P15]|uniref:ATP-dependent Clp protease ATP-binding subunit ClpB n=1 Tax=Giardia intestinalis (strain P15) TaxID=658858 RepID=E1F206_GIAIA|nr:ATP-dependent Clp protease ATP-binding subunit ClpB [Giardia lamblia P15]